MAAAPENQPPAEPSSQKRKRASRPKVKTGCIVCKIRRVKCDETKPACIKCTSTGRKCDGYVKRDDRPESRVQQNEVRATALISTRTNNRVPIPRNPYANSIAGKDKLGGPFEFYKVVTLAALDRGTASAPWNSMILQLSQQVPAVVYAGAAMGELSRRMRLVDIAKMNGVEDDIRPKAVEMQNNADNLYARALTSTREQLSNSDPNSTESALVACFLLQSYEFLRGNAPGTLVHQVNGMAILLRHNQAAQRRGDNRSLSLRSQVTDIFKQWDMRTSAWLGLERPLMSMVADAQERHEVSALTNLRRRCMLGPEGFKDLGDAMKVQRQLLTSCMSLKNSISYWSIRDAADDPEAIEEIKERRRSLLKEAEGWRDAFNILLHRIGPELSEIDTKCAALLDVSTRALRLRVLTLLQPDEAAVYASQTHEFALILNLAKPLLFPTNIMKRMRAGGEGKPSASEELPLAYFNLGLIQVLYHVAVKCDDEELRLRAIEWLEVDPWTEGGFNSAQAARIARQSLGLPDQKDSLKLEVDIQPPGYYHHAHMVPMIAGRQ